MKSNKKFPPELRAVVGQDLKDKSAWIGKTVQEKEDFSKCVSEPKIELPKVWLTAYEAKRVQSALYELLRNSNDKNSSEWLTYWMLIGRIEQVEATNTQEEIKHLEKEIARLKAAQARDDRAKERFLNSLED